MATMIRRARGVVMLCALLAGPAFAAQVHEATATGSTGINTASSKPFPSALTTTYTVGGTHLQIVNNNAPLTSLGGAAATMFSPSIPTSTSGVQLQMSGAGCVFPDNATMSVACPNLGTLQVSFSRPVTNPVLHFVGLGSVRSITGDTVTITASRATHAIATSLPAGATMTVLPGAVNLQTLAGGTALDLVNATYNGTNCSTVTAPATQPGGCGSVRINGTVSSVTLNVGMAGMRNVYNATIANALGDEGYLITTSVDEDFGDAPASYDPVEAASHIVGGLRLGASVDADNSTVLNGTPAVTPSPNAVAAGANNNGTAGDGLDEDGLPVSLPTLHTGLIGQAYTLTPSLAGSTAAGTVCGWIDFNRNGVFETAEGVCNAVASGAVSTSLQWTVPVATTAGRTYVRLRTTQGTQLSTGTPTGRVDSGEVEDYMVEIKPAVQVIKALSPSTDTGRFDLAIGGTVFAANSGHNGSTGFRTLYHNSASGAPDLTVAQNIATTAVTTTVSESPTAATTGSYTSTYSCVNGAGATVATGSGTSLNITLPVSVTGAAANGRAQALTCTFTNTAVATLPTTTVASLVRADASPTNAASVAWTLTFAQPVSGLSAANLALANSGLGGTPAITGVVTVGPPAPATQWRITASTGTGSGTLGLDLLNDTGLSHDVTNVPFTGQTYSIDRTPPTVTITVADTLLTAGETSPVSFVFSEAVSQLPVANITVDNGTLSTPTTTDNITWTATLTPTPGIDDPTNVITLNLAGVSDIAGNAGAGTTPSNNYAIDNVVPVVCPGDVPTPFSQNWTNTGLITTTDDWSGVLGFTGYLGDIGSPINANPTTLTGAALGAIDVIANVTAVSNSAGGVAEMQITNPVVALQGSNAATTPSLVMTLDTTGSSQLVLAYTVRDIDSTGDNAVQPFNAQYRIGSSGAWTNIPGTYLADASAGPSLTLDTPVAVTLPAALNDVGVVQIRFMTTNATGNDEWLGVDDILVTPSCAFAPTVTLQFNAATSSAAEAAGFGNLLRVATSDGNPTTAAATVTVNVTGGSATAADYNRTGTITVPAGTANNALVSIASGITVTNESLVEPNETLQLALAGPAGAVLGTQASTIHTINNDDVATVTVADVSQAEGDGGTSTMSFTVAVDNPVQGGFALDYTTAALTATAGSDYTAATGTMMFAGTAGETQSFGVTINGDTVLETNETFRVSFPSALATVAPGALVITDTATGTITNDDSATVAIGDVSLAEGNAGTSLMTFTATLDTAVQGGFTVNYATANGTATTGDADYVAAAGTLTFTGNAGETRTFAVTLNGDTRVEANETFMVSLNTVSNAGVNITDTATGTLVNDDTARLTVADVAVTEGNAGTSNMIFTATLDNAVQGGFTVNYATADGTATTADNDYIATSGTLSFTGAAGQTRTFVVVVNGDTRVEANETFTVSFNTVSNPAVDITDTATGTIGNNDTAAVTIANFTQPENGTLTFTATLNNATAASFSVDWILAAGTTSAADYVGGVLPAGGTLTFAGMAGETQTLTVPVLDDAVAEPTETFTIGMANLVTAGGFAVDITDTATGTITDNDVAGYTVDTSQVVDIAEPGTSTSFTVRLGSVPSGTVILDFGSTDPTECAVSPASLTFNPGNWNAAQTITITAVDDLVVDGTQPCAATITRTGGTATEYGTAPNPANVTLNVADNDVAGITVGPTTVALSESAGTATFAISANTAPTGNVMIPVTTDGQCDVDTGSGFGTAALLTLPAGSTAPRTVAVRAVNDAVIEGAHACAITTGNPTSAADAAYDALGANDVADVTATVTDNDVLHTLAAGAGGPEGTGANPVYSFTVTRSGAINVASSTAYSLGGSGVAGVDYGAVAVGGAGVSATPTTINFAANATTATVSVAANADSIAEPDFTLALTLSTPIADGGAGTGAIAGSPASLTVTDDDVAGYLVDTSATAATISEPSGSTTFTIALGSQPAGTVVLDFGSTDPTECSVSPASFTFTAGNWTTPQTITINAVDDALVDGTQPCAATITRNAAGTAPEYAALANPANVNINVEDDDVPGVSVTPTAVDATEGGFDGSYTVVLDSQPSGNVSIAITGDTQVATAPTSLQFTAANWNIPQTVTVTAIDDAIAEGAHTGTITHVSSGADYDGVAVAGVTVGITDNDAGGIVVTPIAGLETTEAGGTATFTVVLASEPTGDVSITLSSSDTGEGTVAPAALLFTAATWDTAQTVTVTGIDDDVADGDVAYTILTAAAVSTDATYDGVDAADIAVINRDDDAIGVTVTPTAVGATEGGAGSSYGIVLASEPTGTVSIAVTTDAQVTATPATLQFTAVNWNVAQTVAVAAVDDAIAEGSHTGTITHAASGADYAGAAVASVTVDITDNDSGSIIVTPTAGLDTTEAGGTATFTVVLGSEPTAAVSLALSSSDSGEGTIDTATLAFDDTNWNVAQTVTITGVGDDMADGDIAYTIVTAAAVSTDATYNGLDAADVAVTNRDDDARGVTVTPTSTTATEGGAGGSYTVVLQSEPTDTVSIAITPDAQVTTTPNTLQFTAANWNVAQTVAVTAVDDTVAEGNHTGTITHAASGGDYTGAAVASVNVDIADNDTGGIVVTPTAGLATTEAGGTASFTVVLASEPTADVTIALSSSDADEGTVAPAALVFDATNWNAAQTVTVTGVDDAIVDGNVAYTIVTAAAVSADPVYSGVDADDVSVTNADDDTASLRIDDISLSEGDGGTTAFVLTVTLDGAIDGGVSVAYATADGTATAGSDYSATSGTLTFDGTDGETRTITVPVDGDTLVEADETFTVALAAPTPASVTLARATATATVRNDDGAAQLIASKRVSRIGTPTVPVLYEIVLRNTGAGAQADDPGSDELVDVLPASLALRTATATSGNIGVDLPANTVRWNGALAAGASVTVMIEADVVATTSGPISNRATLRYDSDGDGENDTDAVSDNPDTVAVDDTVFEFVAGGITPPALEPQVIPTLDAWMLVWLSFGFGVFGLWSIRRQR